MNKPRLINANRMCYGGDLTFDKNLEFCDHLDLEEWVNNQPTIDPEALPIVQELRKKLAECEPRQGHWIDNTYCSCCGGFDEDEEGNIVQSYHCFCPSCGAKMDGI